MTTKDKDPNKGDRRTWKVMLKDTRGNLLPSSFKGSYSQYVAAKIVDKMNTGHWGKLDKGMVYVVWNGGGAKQ